MKKQTKKNNQKKFSKIIVALVLIINVLFTGFTLFVFLKVGSEPVALIGAWFTFTTTELWSLSSIKKTEIKSEKEKTEENFIDIKGA